MGCCISRRGQARGALARAVLGKDFSLEGARCPAKVVEVLDGDTVRAVLQIPGTGSAAQFRVRLAGYDAPETRSRDAATKAAGLRAKAWLTALLLGKTVELRCGKFDSFGRVLAAAALPDGRDVAAEAIGLGYGLACSGARPAWAPEDIARVPKIEYKKD